MRFNLAEGFPIVTGKKTILRSIIYELLWFLQGETNIKYLKDNDVSIWDAWADENGDLSGACTTSGLAYKMAGRVGDSPIIGSGLFVDNEVGAAVATGLGEEVVKTVGSFLVVELMRQGKSPQEACEEAIRRIVSKPNSDYKNFQVGYIALNKNGETGYYAIHDGFSMTQFANGENTNLKAGNFIDDQPQD